MANLKIDQSQDFSNLATGYGSVESFTNTGVTIKDKLGGSILLSGTFYYSGGSLSGGTVAGLTYAINDAVAYTISDIKTDAVSVLDYLGRADIKSLNEYILSGADTISGSTGADTLFMVIAATILFMRAMEVTIYIVARETMCSTAELA
jgi:hypothetical protein